MRYRLLSIVLLLTSWALAVPTLGAQADEAESAKEEIIRGILIDFQHEHYVDPNKCGRIYSVVIKDFCPDDKKTYAIIDQLQEFFVISIPAKKKSPACGKACSSIHWQRKVRKDLVALTRAKGLKRHFTVPLRAEDLPPRI